MYQQPSLPLEKKPEYFLEFDENELQTTIVDRFEKQVQLYPDSIAVKDGNQVLNYCELNRRANHIAYLILDIVGQYRGPIAIYMEHGISQIAAILGILKSGNAYLILDPDFPQTRLKEMVIDSRTPLLITTSVHASDVPEIISPEINIIDIDRYSDRSGNENPNLNIGHKEIAAIYYTSGSTGKPKGCILHHQLIMHQIMSMTNRFFITPKDRFLFLLSVTYAGSNMVLFGALLNGACLCMYDIKKQGLNPLYDFLTGEEITVYASIPSTFRYFTSILDPETSLACIRVVMVGGDTVLKNDVEQFARLFPPSSSLINSYGCTECPSICSYVITTDSKIPDKVVPVGFQVEGKQVQLEDENGNDVSPGEIGEIVIQSPYLSPGYWNQPELTQEKFSPVPGREQIYQYKTGDLGRMDSNGCLYHLGRKDQQVKVRGHRVELGDITSTILAIPSIRDAYVRTSIDDKGESQLIAFLVPAIPTDTLVEDLLDEIKMQLPSYMIPTDFIVLDEIPKLPSGKVDIQRLPDVKKSRSSLRTEYLPPNSSTEGTLVDIMERTLDFKPIGIEDDFFELGGHSLLGLRLVAEIEQNFGINLPFPALVQNPTVEKLATIINDADALHIWSHLIALQPLGSRPPLFCVPPSAVTAMVFKDLAKHLGEDQPFYGLDYLGMDGESEPHNSIIEMAKFNIDRIRVIQPKGPYYLGGMCFGGLVAYEMAQQLIAEGEGVPFLGIFDSTHAPNIARPHFYTVFMITHFINQKILRKRFPLGMAPIRRSMRKFHADDEIGKRIYDVFTTHNYARITYLTNTYPGTITLFNTAGSRGDFSRQQWRRVAGGKLEIVSIPGTHSGALDGFRNREQAFMHEPNVRFLAQRVNACLEDAR